MHVFIFFLFFFFLTFEFRHRNRVQGHATVVSAFTFEQGQIGVERNQRHKGDGQRPGGLLQGLHQYLQRRRLTRTKVNVTGTTLHRPQLCLFYVDIIHVKDTNSL